MNLLKSVNGMKITGQGPRIVRLTIPAILLALFLYVKLPAISVLPEPHELYHVAGIFLITAGCLLWLTAIIQLLRDFPKGKLVTKGAFAVCRNPIYASYALFIIPGISLLFNTWTGLLPSFAMSVAICTLCKKEESDLERIFGEEFKRYRRKCGPLFPTFRRERNI